MQPPATPTPSSSPAAAGGDAPSTKALTDKRVRRPTLGGLAELTVDSTNGFEVLSLPAKFVDGAPAPIRAVLSKAQLRTRQISQPELFAAGLLGGCAAEVAKTVVLHPLDTAKTHAQVVSTRVGLNPRLGPAVSPS